MKTVLSWFVVVVTTRGVSASSRTDALTALSVDVLSTPVPVKVSDHSATVLRDKIYLFGGCTGDQVGYTCPSVSSTMYEFNPLSLSFATLPSASIGRLRHSAEAVGSNIYIIGGRILANDALVSSIDVFNTRTSTWSISSLSLTSDQQTSDACSWRSGVTIYVAGGYNAAYAAKSTVLMWSPLQSGSTFTTVNTSMNIGRGDCRAVVRRDHEQAWVIGGFDSSFQLVNQIDTYDMITNQWTLMASSLVDRGDKAAVFWNDAVYAFGGENLLNTNRVVLDSIEVYDPATNTHAVSSTKLPLPKFRYAAADYGGMVYLFGGQTSATGASSDTYPVTDDVYIIQSSSCPSSAASSATSNLPNGIVFTAASLATSMMLYAII
jgi:hypothetical protein